MSVLVLNWQNFVECTDELGALSPMPIMHIVYFERGRRTVMKDEDELLSKMALASTDGPSEEDTILQVRSSEADFMATAVLVTTYGCVADVMDVTGPAFLTTEESE